jgi:hypothetical protein
MKRSVRKPVSTLWTLTSVMVSCIFGAPDRVLACNSEACPVDQGYSCCFQSFCLKSKNCVSIGGDYVCCS